MSKTNTLPTTMTTAPENNVAGPNLIEKASKALAAEVAHHVETMYPKATDAVAWNSCKRSLSGVVQITMKRLGDAAEIGQMDKVIKSMAIHRREIKELREISEKADRLRKQKEREKQALGQQSDGLDMLDRIMSGNINSIWGRAGDTVTYTIIERAIMSEDATSYRGQNLVICKRSLDKKIIVYPEDEFFDGRFVRLN